MKGKWAKDLCPYVKDQQFPSVAGDVEQGEKIFGFSHTQVAGADAIVFKTATRGVVTQMESATTYEVTITKVSSGSEVSVPYATALTKVGLTLTAEAGEDYDIIVKGKVLY